MTTPLTTTPIGTNPTCNAPVNFFQRSDRGDTWEVLFECGIGGIYPVIPERCTAPDDHPRPTHPGAKPDPAEPAWSRFSESIGRLQEIGWPKFLAGFVRYGGISGKPAMLSELEHEIHDAWQYVTELRLQLRTAKLAAEEILKPESGPITDRVRTAAELLLGILERLERRPEHD